MNPTSRGEWEFFYINISIWDSKILNDSIKSPSLLVRACTKDILCDISIFEGFIPSLDTN